MASPATQTMSFTVHVSEEDGIWTAVSDELGLVTEAEDFASLTRRAWEILPDLLALNGYEVPPGGVQLRFEHIETRPLTV